MKNIPNMIVGVIVIIIGIITLIFLIRNVEIVIGSITLTFGIMAIIWTVKARKSLSTGSLLKSFTTIFLYCLIFILAFSIWQSLINIFAWKEVIGVRVTYPTYAFISLAYIFFVTAAYKILILGKEFGFQIESKNIKKLIKKKKKHQ